MGTMTERSKQMFILKVIHFCLEQYDRQLDFCEYEKFGTIS